MASKSLSSGSDGWPGLKQTFVLELPVSVPRGVWCMAVAADTAPGVGIGVPPSPPSVGSVAACTRGSVGPDCRCVPASVLAFSDRWAAGPSCCTEHATILKVMNFRASLENIIGPRRTPAALPSVARVWESPTWSRKRRHRLRAVSCRPHRE